MTPPASLSHLSATNPSWSLPSQACLLPAAERRRSPHSPAAPVPLPLLARTLRCLRCRHQEGVRRREQARLLGRGHDVRRLQDGLQGERRHLHRRRDTRGQGSSVPAMRMQISRCHCTCRQCGWPQSRSFPRRHGACCARGAAERTGMRADAYRRRWGDATSAMFPHHSGGGVCCGHEGRGSEERATERRICFVFGDTRNTRTRTGPCLV